MNRFENCLRDLINSHSLENDSNTPDYILAMYLQSCLTAFNSAVQQRETHYRRDPRPTYTKLSQLEKDGIPSFYINLSELPCCTHRMNESDIPVWCANGNDAMRAMDFINNHFK